MPNAKTAQNALLVATILAVLSLAGCPSSPSNVSVPYLIGLTQPAAESAVTNAGLTIGTVTGQYSDTVPAGCVISQNPLCSQETGASVAQGSAISIVVSQGAEPVAPTAAFSADHTAGNGPLTVQFTDSSTAGSASIASWVWDFGDGRASTEQNPSHTYATEGSYSVTLIVISSVGSDAETKTDYITVSAAPVGPTAAFTADPISGDAPLTVQFTDSSSAGSASMTSWLWDFGDSSTSAEQNPSHTYATEGSYSVALTVVTSVGSDAETKTDYITVSATPVGPSAEFIADRTAGAAPFTVQFTDSSSAGSASIASWVWDFGDGRASTEQNPSHTYATEGSYSVALTVISSVGSDAETKTDYITVSAAPVGPTAAFTADPTSGDAPLTVQFTDSSSAGSASIASWVWDFGDGRASTEQNPSHTYASEGSYSVALTVISSVGSDAETKTDYITVSAAPVGPTAAFTADPTSGDAPLTVQFTDSSNAGSASIASWLWNFGDSSTSTEQNPSHTYATEGSYAVALTVVTSVGSDAETKTDYITVSAAPVGPTAAFTADPTSGNAPLTVQFTDSSSAGSASITSWLWNFGDSSTSTEQNPSHTYASEGSYAVALTVVTSVGSDAETKTDYITVSAAPVGPTAAFTADPTSGDAPLTVQFTDSSSAGSASITSWLWNFGDSSTSTEQNPSHTYTSEGSYSVALTVVTSVGSDAETKTDYITVSAAPVGPTAAFTADPTSGNAPLTVQFTDSSNAGSAPITSWLWNFGDSSTSTEQNPSHTYASEGSYTVSLTAATSVGFDAETKTDYITVSAAPVGPTAAFTADPTSGDAPLTVQFTDSSNAGSASITSWLWNFGDSSTSTERNPSHTYTSEGSYTVSLTVATSVGSDAETAAITVTAAPIAVPSVVGMTEAAAQTAITSAGLTVGARTETNSDTVLEGNIISQAPVGGTSVAPGSTVNLVVSLGTVPAHLHRLAWQALAEEAQDSESMKFAIYSSRSLMVKHPEVYLQADAVWMEEIVTRYGGWLAEYNHRDRLNDDTYSDNVRAAINDAFYQEVIGDGSEFSWDDFQWSHHRQNASSWHDFQPEDAPYYPWLDMRLPLLWNAMKGINWTTPYLSLAEALYFELRSEERPVYLAIADSGRGYVVESDGQTSQLYDPMTAEKSNKTTIEGQIVLVMTQHAVWYPLMGRDDRSNDSGLSMAVNLYATPEAQPALADFEDLIWQNLFQNTELATDMDERWAVVCASRFGKQKGWRAKPIRDLTRCLFPEAYTQCGDTYTDIPTEFTALNMMITELGNRVSPAAALLASEAQGQAEAGLTVALIAMSDKYRAWFKRTDNDWVYGEYFRAWLPNLDDKLVSGVGDCFVEACNVGAAMHLVREPDWDVWVTNYWETTESGGHVVAGVYTSTDGKTLSNGLYNANDGACTHGPLWAIYGQVAYPLVYRLASGFIATGQSCNGFCFSPFVAPFTNLAYDETVGLLGDIDSYEPECQLVSGTYADLQLVSVPDYVAYLATAQGQYSAYLLPPTLSAPVAAPNLTELTEVECVAALAGPELLLGSATLEFSNTVPEGCVISQSPDPGTSIVPGTAIDVVVSAGPALMYADDYFIRTEGHGVRYPHHGHRWRRVRRLCVGGVSIHR